MFVEVINDVVLAICAFLLVSRFFAKKSVKQHIIELLKHKHMVRYYLDEKYKDDVGTCVEFFSQTIDKSTTWSYNIQDDHGASIVVFSSDSPEKLFAQLKNEWGLTF